MKRYGWLVIAFLVVFGIAATATHGPFAIRDTAPSLTFTDSNGDDFDILVDGDGMSFRNRDAGGGTTDYAVTLPASAGTLALASAYYDSTQSAVFIGQTIKGADPTNSYRDTTAGADDYEVKVDANIYAIRNMSAGGGTLLGSWAFSRNGNLSINNGGIASVNGTASSGYIVLFENTANGSDYAFITAPDSLAAAITVTGPSSTGTLALTSDNPPSMKAQWFEPTAADTEIALTIDSPATITIASISCYSWDGTTTLTVTNGASFGATDITDAGGLVCATDAVTSDTTLTNTTITAGNIVAVDISAVAGDPTRIHVEIRE